MSALREFLGNKPFEEVKALLEAEPFHCLVKEDPNFPELYLLKYDQLKSDFYNPIVRECRGSILAKGTNEFVCRPFDKFGNHGEGYASEIDWESSTVTEKLDGSLIKIWFYGGVWHISTNGTIDAFSADLQAPFHDEKIEELLPIDTFGRLTSYALLKDCGGNPRTAAAVITNLDKKYTHLFELCTPHNRVVVPHTKSSLFYLTSRNTYTGREERFSSIGLNCPKRYFLSNLEDTIAAAMILPFNDEGYVVEDSHGARLKVKSPAYVAVHHLHNNGVINRKRLLDLVLLNELDEFLSYFSEYTDTAKAVQDSLADFMEAVENDIDPHFVSAEAIVNAAETKDDKRAARKGFAEWATKTAYPGLMFSLLDGKAPIDDWQNAILSMPSEKLLNIIDRYKKE